LLSIGRATSTCRHVATRNFHACGARKSETAIVSHGGQVELTTDIFELCQLCGKSTKTEFKPGSTCLLHWIMDL
jgi:hypothetical protein